MSANSANQTPTTVANRLVPSASASMHANVLTPLSLPTYAGSMADSLEAARAGNTTVTTNARTILKPREVSPVVLSAKSRFLLHESWEGVVEEVFSTYFSAQIVSSLDSDRAEYVEILVDEVSPADRPLLAEGSMFYWSIGYQESRDGQRTRSSILKFRRLPKLDKSETKWVKTVRDAWLRSS